MRKTTLVLAAVFLLVVAAPDAKAVPPSTKDTSGTIVITFKDGHQQFFSVSSIGRMELKAAGGTSIPISIPGIVVPGRSHFLGKWAVGDGNGGTIYMTLEDNGEATKSNGASHGTWIYVDGEAHVSWDDGWHDAIRKVGSKHEKFAFAPGESFSDKPANVTEAHNTTPRAI
jgi:hypothetical protein